MRIKIAGGIAIVVAVAVALVLWSPWGSSTSGSSLPANAVFRIGDRVITVDQLNARDKALAALYGVEKPTGAKELATFNREAAKSMAINLVLDEAIAQQHVVVTDSQVTEAENALIASQFSNSRTTFTQEIAQAGVTETVVRDEIRRQLALRVLLNKVAGNVTATDAEAVAAYSANEANLGSPERRVVYNIVVATQAEAAQVRTALDGGASVTALAKQVSIDGATHDKGGLLGTVTSAQLLPAVATAVFAVKAGGAYGPVEGAQGWNVGQVTKVIPGVPPSLKAALPALRQIVINQKKQTAWIAWLSARLRTAKIAYAAGYLPKDPNNVSAWTGSSASSIGQ
ncbi:MAG TPA: peptidyl-prolyl cis-trans isomerase [Marmoricola sp.]|nr:peptidyl-prolyl cis-trans isomerase [Marmoricola sp.]